MFSFEVNGKEYKIKYGYGTLGNTTLLDSVQNKSEANSLKGMISSLADFLAYGLWMEHPEFRFETDKEKAEVMEKVYSLMDAYESESTDEKPKDCFDLYEKLQEELLSVGFLKKVNQMMQIQNAKANKKK